MNKIWISSLVVLALSACDHPRVDPIKVEMPKMPESHEKLINTLKEYRQCREIAPARIHLAGAVLDRRLKVLSDYSVRWFQLREREIPLAYRQTYTSIGCSPDFVKSKVGDARWIDPKNGLNAETVLLCGPVETQGSLIFHAKTLILNDFSMKLAQIGGINILTHHLVLEGKSNIEAISSFDGFLRSVLMFSMTVLTDIQGEGTLELLSTAKAVNCPGHKHEDHDEGV